jgi:putative redox protein
MIEIDTTYDGDLHCTATHGPSQSTLQTDAPKDNHGRGATFSPTDLLATALGTCMATTMGILARKQGWDLSGLRVNVIKEMTTSPPRKIARLPTCLFVPEGTARQLTAEARAQLENAAHTCPVKLSLADSVEVLVTFDWEGIEGVTTSAR